MPPITIALTLDPVDLDGARDILRALQAAAERRRDTRRGWRTPGAPTELDRAALGCGAVLADAIDAARARAMYQAKPYPGLWISRGSIGGGATTSEVGLHGAITHRLGRISCDGPDPRPALDTLERELTILIADVRAMRAGVEE